jgi:arabinogalactan oligomer/maltooligosaccharide transport system permease protein
MAEVAERLPAGTGGAEAAGAREPGRFRRWSRAVGWRHLVAIAVVLFALYPVAWVVSASFNPRGGLSGQQLIPRDTTLTNYTRLIDRYPFQQWFVNTMVIAGVSALLITVNSAAAAYAFSRMRFKGRRAGLLGLLLIQMFPANLAVVALFLLLVGLSDIVPAVAIGEYWGLIVVYVGTGLGVNVWLMKGFFDTIPISLDESARVDGASHFQVFRQIILPLVAPILAVVALISFVFIQNDVILASAMLKEPPDQTLAVGLFRFVSQRYEARWGLFAAGAMMGGIPVVALWFALQRYIVSGLTAGSVKG